MSAVETKNPGHFTTDVGKHVSDAEWGTDQYPLTDSELSYALGRDGSTRRKLARASGCIMEYVGPIAYLAGSKAERMRARDYLKWLLKQRNGAPGPPGGAPRAASHPLPGMTAGPVRVEDVDERDDVSKMRVPADCAGYVTGNRGSTLRQVSGWFPEEAQGAAADVHRTCRHGRGQPVAPPHTRAAPRPPRLPSPDRGGDWHILLPRGWYPRRRRAAPHLWSRQRRPRARGARGAAPRRRETQHGPP